MNKDKLYGRLLYIPVIVICISVLIIADNLSKSICIPLGVIDAKPQPDYAASLKTEPFEVELVEPCTDCGGRLDINSATAEELDELPQIGKVRAEAIMKQRDKMGGFMSGADVMCTNGIGDGIYNGIKDNICALPYEVAN